MIPKQILFENEKNRYVYVNTIPTGQTADYFIGSFVSNFKESYPLLQKPPEKVSNSMYVLLILDLVVFIKFFRGEKGGHTETSTTKNAARLVSTKYILLLRDSIKIRFFVCLLNIDQAWSKS